MPTLKPARFVLYLLFGVCPLLFFTDLTRNPYYTQIALLNIFVPLLWLVWLIQSWKSNEFVWVSSRLDVALGSLFAVCLISWFLSMYLHPHFLPSIYSEGSKRVIFLLVNMGLVFAAAVRVEEPELKRRLLGVTYAVSALAAAYGIAQYFGVEVVWPRQLNPYGNRPVSTFGNPNFMSSFLVVVLPVMVTDYFLKVTGYPRALLFIAIQLSAGAMLATLTRSSWAGVSVGFLFAAWGMRRNGERPGPGAWPLLLAMGALVLLWPRGGESYVPAVVERLSEMKRAATESYGSVYQRFLIWIASWSMIEDHPFFGKGWGCFELFYPFYQGPLLFVKALAARTHANNAHNEILEYWSQIGTVGLGIVAWMWVLFFRVGENVSRRLEGSWRTMTWAMMGGVAGMLVDNLLNVSAHFAVPAFIFWWWIGSVMSQDRSALKHIRVSLLPVWRKGLVVFGAVGLILLMARAGAMWAAEVNFFHGFKLSKGGVALDQAARALERAYQWHRLEVNNNYELGNVYARLNEREKAIYIYQRALDANAGYDEIYFNRATLLMQLGREEEAMALYRICLAINPLSQQAYNALAGLYFKNFAVHGAKVEALYRSGLRVFPNDKDLWNNLGYYYTQVGDWLHAVEAYEAAIRLDPQFELAAKNLAVVRKKAAMAASAPKH